MKLIRTIRRRYPNTAKLVLIVLAAIATLPFPHVRKAGELVLALLAVMFAVAAMEKLSR